MTATITGTCYRETNGFIQPQEGWVVCPSSYQGLCCGPEAECLDEQICHDPKNSHTGSSGYYMGLCTDPTYNSLSCSSRCTDHKWGDVVYNSTSYLWTCCGTDQSCGNPTNETFLAPPPQQLLAAASSQSATRAAASSSQPRKTAASSSVSKVIMTVSSTPSAADDQTTSSLNGGAKAGIGVGAVVAAVAIVALVAWVILLRKKLNNQGQARGSMGRLAGGMMDEGLPRGAWETAVPEQELSGHSFSHEMEESFPFADKTCYIYFQRKEPKVNAQWTAYYKSIVSIY